MLAYGVAIDYADQYLKISASTALECMKKFCLAITRYLGKSTWENQIKRMSIDYCKWRNLWFFGMFGCIDSMHWEWKNCSAGWKGSFQKGIYKVATIILEAVALYDTWIWHVFFSLPGSANDITIFYCSLVFWELYKGRAPKCEYIINGHKYNIRYFLLDGIYPKWSALIKIILFP